MPSQVPRVVLGGRREEHGRDLSKRTGLVRVCPNANIMSGTCMVVATEPLSCARADSRAARASKQASLSKQASKRLTPHGARRPPSDVAELPRAGYVMLAYDLSTENTVCKHGQARLHMVRDADVREHSSIRT